MNHTARPFLRVSPLTALMALALMGFFFWLGLTLLKYNYPDTLISAKDVPGWMVDGHFGTFTDADMLTLRRGQCSHDPISIRPKADGTAVLTCGGPAQIGSVLLFVADTLDVKSINGRAR